MGAQECTCVDTVTHVVALSGGKDSTAMALRLRQLNPSQEYKYVCTPTGDELPETVEHWAKLEKLLEQPIIKLQHPLGLNGLIEKFGALPNWRQRWCTRILKIEQYAAWLVQHTPAVSYVGIRADEPEREAGDYASIPNVEMRFPMREWDWDINDVYEYLDTRGVTIPKRTDCGRCFFQRIGEWKTLLEEHPDVYWDAAAQEERIGATYRGPNRDTWPAKLSELAFEFQAGRPLRDEGNALSHMQCRICRM